MADKVVYIARKDLEKAAGKEYMDILIDMIDEGLIKAIKPYLAITFDSSKAIHIQAALEFYEVQGLIIPSNKKGDK